ncbi:MAG: pilus assembly FimT family protein [Candidatus Hydrogenedentales bacterium]|jgi:prepilin-type N-terminal cleavage/methylation domain-containing protein
MKKKKSHKGFTLIELVLVLMLLAILASVQLPRMHGRTKRMNLKTEAELLSRLAGLAATKARLERCTVRLCFGETPQQLVFEEALNAPESAAAFTRITTGPLGRNIVPTSTIETLPLSNDGAIWIFEPDGTIEGSEITLSLGEYRTGISPQPTTELP